MFITLEEWDKANYSKPHHMNTLRKWAKEGRFEPPAEKHGREWLVKDVAKLRPLDHSTANQLRQAQKMMNDEQTTYLDPKVLEILNGSRAA